MKRKLLLLIVAGLTAPILHAQEIKDAMRYTQSELHGTARFTAMSGAFGALGGDLSSLNINPAGSAVFNNNQFSTTIGNYDTKNESNYFGTRTSASESTFDLTQAGGVFIFKTGNPNNDWRKFALAINYENTNNYDNSIFSAGVSPVHSVANYFVSYANGVPLSTLQDSEYAELGHGAQQAFLGYQGYIINPVTETADNELYRSNVRAGGNYYQENSFYSTGNNGKVVFNTAVQFQDFLYFGLNLNTHFTDYVQNTNFYESNNNNPNSNFDIERLNFSNTLHTFGSGFSFQVGAIAKLNNEIRLGFAYESPTWYNLQDEFSQRLTSVNRTATNVIDPIVINYYAPYDLQTPGSITGSFAYVFGKSGLISMDYKYKNYGNTEYGPESDPYFRNINNEMSRILGSSHEVRVGAEYKIDHFKFRGGYRFEGSPYKDSVTQGDLNSFSAGLGYSFGPVKLDLSYVNVHTSSREQFFSQGFTEQAWIKTYKNNFTMTFTFEM